MSRESSALREAIYQGIVALASAGERMLQIEEFAQRFGVTRGQVRYAIQVLLVEGWVEEEWAGQKCRRVTVVATGERTGWNMPPPAGFAEEKREQPAGLAGLPPAAANPRRLYDVRWIPKTCRFPSGGRGNWSFCERPVLPGTSYCPEHYALCYSVGRHTRRKRTPTPATQKEEN